jgi:hypothetical protein
VNEFVPNVGRTLILRRDHAESAAAAAARREREVFYSSRPWRLTRQRYLACFPLCSLCNHAVATVVDHNPSRLTLPPSEWFSFNRLRGLCKPCHDEHGQRTRNDRGGGSAEIPDGRNTQAEHTTQRGRDLGCTPYVNE